MQVNKALSQRNDVRPSLCTHTMVFGRASPPLPVLGRGPPAGPPVTPGPQGPRFHTRPLLLWAEDTGGTFVPATIKPERQKL